VPYLLSLIVWLPALAALIILLFIKKEERAIIRYFSTGAFGLTFLVSLGLTGYDRQTGGMQFLEDFEWIPIIGARYQMGVDGVSVLLILLTTLLGLVSALSSWRYIQKREKEYYVLLLLLQTFVVASLPLWTFFSFISSLKSLWFPCISLLVYGVVKTVSMRLSNFSSIHLPAL
jgi:NADH-quinone oxidoreductase subunit M